MLIFKSDTTTIEKIWGGAQGDRIEVETKNGCAIPAEDMEGISMALRYTSKDENIERMKRQIACELDLGYEEALLGVDFLSITDERLKGIATIEYYGNKIIDQEFDVINPLS